MKTYFFQIVFLLCSCSLLYQANVQGYSFWNTPTTFTFNDQVVAADSSQATYDAFVKALRAHGYTVSSFITGQILNKRTKVEAVLLQKFGMDQADWQNIKSILSSYASQQRGGSITGPESIAALIRGSVQPLPSLKIEFKDNEPSVFHIMSISAGILRSMIAYLTSSPVAGPLYFNLAETPILYLPMNFESRPLLVQMGTIFHEVAGHINHSHVVENVAVRKLISKKCSMSLSEVEQTAEWLKFKRLQEIEADWYPALKDSKSATYIESMLQHYYKTWGHCDGKGTEHPDNLKRYHYATIIRKLLETEQQVK